MLGLTFLASFLAGPVLADNTKAKPSAEWVLAAGNHPPWFYSDRSTDKGIAFDILSQVASSMGYTPKLHMMPTKRIYAELLKGSAHFSIVLVHDEVLSYPQGLLMGKERLVAYPVVAVALKSRQLNIDSLAQLKALHVGNLMMPQQVDPYLQEGFTHTGYAETTQLLKGLLSDRVDVAITATLNFLATAKRLGVLNELEIIYTLGHDSMYLVFSQEALGDDAAAEVRRADAALRALKETGRLAEIIAQYADVNNFVDYGKRAP